MDDLLSVTTLKTDEDGDRTYEITWATTDYDLMPYNATLESQAQPYSHLQTTPDGDYTVDDVVAAYSEFALCIARGINA